MNFHASTFLRAICGLILSAVLAAPAAPSADDRMRQLIATEWDYQMRTSPEFATFTGDNRFNDKLSDYSAQAVARSWDHARKLLAALQGIDPTQLSAEERINHSLLEQSTRTALDGVRFKTWEMPVDQMNGPHVSYAGLPNEVPLKTVRDYENYLSRLRLLPRVFSQVTSNIRLGIQDQLLPPAYLLEKVAEESHDIASKSVDESPFTAPLRRFPENISAADRQRLTQSIRDAVAKQVLPAYAAFEKFVRTEYAPKGRKEYGLWSLPDGQARYRQAIVELTTTHSDPEQLHALGLKQVGEIEQQMLVIAHKQGYSSLKAFNAHIFKDPAVHATSGEQIFGLYKRYTDQMYSTLPKYFGRLPKNKLIVVPMEAYRAPHEVPADYSIGAGDGSRPGRINVNEYEPKRRLLLNVEAIAYHEGIPGHHLQFSIAQELTGLPPFRRFTEYNSFSEGWALYSETLAHEMGFYRDAYSEYGRLQNLMWRSVRLVVDTGVHSKHWSRQQMIDFFHEHTAMDDQNIETEVDRYIAWPAQALCYKLGEMTILRLREKAKKDLGSKFDIREFHDAVLGSGPLPLDVFENGMNQWIAKRAKR